MAAEEEELAEWLIGGRGMTAARSAAGSVAAFICGERATKNSGRGHDGAQAEATAEAATIHRQSALFSSPEKTPLEGLLQKEAPRNHSPPCTPETATAAAAPVERDSTMVDFGHEEGAAHQPAKLADAAAPLRDSPPAAVSTASRASAAASAAPLPPPESVPAFVAPLCPPLSATAPRIAAQPSPEAAATQPSPELLLAALRLFTPRPLIAAGNIFLVFLGCGQHKQPRHQIHSSSGSLVRLFFLAFFSLILGISDAFWLLVKCTGPYGMSWLEPKFYWKPFILGAPAISATPTAEFSQEKPPPASASATERLLPPEHLPAVFQIYLELGTFCVSPFVCLVGAWLAWRLYKARLPSLEAPPLASLRGSNHKRNAALEAPTRLAE
ncbi:uncharacterized protein LOC113146498 [Cyclospora cayetanensis]|uniref:Uncharacterized protein LOC113146498 n=1 Tax=Cyclospora cayetanensis TaxID=88456 RepID=A0A6P6RQI5_9EIME|nr:uncharacterized protein LOC113146498 [Cyclospora cayetanensis]